MAAGLLLYKQQVRQLLTDNCVSCHGGDATEGNFSVASRALLLRGGDSGPAVLPGKATSSLLMRLVEHADEPAMPQDASKLPDADIAALRRWIELGAAYDGPLIDTAAPAELWTNRTVPESAREFWSMQPLADATPPALEDAWIRNDIDRFVLAKLRAAGVEPNAPADRVILARRLNLDLLGVPPTPQEVASFMADAAPDAVATRADRLLADQRFGERWARHWLDVARFAESHGFEQDYDRPFAYHYRDFVIRAFNDDLPFDDFVKWQLAGDEIAPGEALPLMATGFLAAGVFPTQITANEVERTRYDALDDMAATTGVAFLGLTIGCARCHDHKFDPIPQADYYRFVSTFTTTVRGNVPVTVPVEAASAGPVVAPRAETVMIASEGIAAIRHHTQGGDFLPETHYLRRGDSDQKEAVAPAGFLQVLTRHPDGAAHWTHTPPTGSHTSGRRTALADWMTDTRDGPGHLVARVIVNRLWQHHFGTGLVATPNDFGAQGSPPSHPELLDWLAARLIAGGWRLKPIHHLILTSATYGQGSDWHATAAAVDPGNRLLWRFAPRRLEAEALRDAMLSVSGRLDSQMYGPGSLDESTTRRSIYFTIKRSRLIPVLTIFDVPEPNTSIGNRPSTVVAPQALHLLNNPQVRACAMALADRVTQEAPEALIQQAYRLTLSRPPSSDERAVAEDFLAQQTASYSAAGQADAAHLALADICQVLLASNEFAYLP